MKIVNGLHIAETDAEWSKAVKLKCGGHCAWVGCTSTSGLGAHHVFPRKYFITRFIVENGLLLCFEHHTKVEELKGTMAYVIMMKKMLGISLFKMLQNMVRNSLKFKTDKCIEMPSSEIDF